MPTIGDVINEVLTEFMHAIAPPPARMLDAVSAIVDGTETPEQLEYLVSIVHTQFDALDGCMIDVVSELASDGFPHRFINHAIRTYVRKADTREKEVAANA